MSGGPQARPSPKRDSRGPKKVASQRGRLACGRAKRPVHLVKGSNRLENILFLKTTRRGIGRLRTPIWGTEGRAALATTAGGSFPECACTGCASIHG